MNEYLQDEREIKGYVDIEYSEIDNTLPVSAEINYPTIAPISQFSNEENQRISKNYASLEENYFLLDGSFVLPYKPTEETTYYNINSGYISNDIVEDIQNAQIEINSISKTIDGITIYFKDNIPSTINFTFINIDDEIINYNFTENIDDIIPIKFETKQTIKSMLINLNDFEFENRRIRISKIDFGLSDILEDKNLIDFTITENIGDLNLEFPTNQLTVNLYDENNIFDINNPKGYADLLSQGNKVKVKPVIGIVTEKEGIKYNEDISTFYLQSWANNKNEITLNCVDYLEKIKNIKSVNKNGELLLSESNCETLDANLSQKIGIQVESFTNFKDSQNYLADTYIATNNTYEYLQQLMIWLWGYIYNEKNKIIIDKRTNSNVYNDMLTLNYNLIEEPKYTAREPIKSVSITQYTGDYVDNQRQWQSAEIIYSTNSEKAFNNKPEIVELDNYHKLHVEASGISQDIGINKVFNASEYCPTTITPASNITFYDLGNCNFKTSTYKKIFNENGKEITIDNKFFKTNSLSGTYTIDQICESLCNKINDENKTYDVSISYVGDPYIRPNMIVPIETQYGQKLIKVLKHSLTFNGGLKGTIEGVGD